MRLVLLALSLLAVPATGESKAPDLGAPLPLAIEQVVLDNGLTLLLSPRPGIPIVAAGWSVATGSADDPPGQRGSAHLLEHMLLQGTGTVGIRDRVREVVVHRRQDLLSDQLEALAHSGRDPTGERERDLLRRIAALDAEAATLALPGELSLLYAQHGATRLQAVTYPDLGFHTVILPAGRLEIWFWLESDRLLDPVFRGLSREQRVVEEERRQMATASSSVLLDRALETLFWGADHPYANDTLGRPAEVAHLSRALLRQRFLRDYRPENLTLALVGGFESDRARTLAKRYFGRLVPRPDEPRSAAVGAGSSRPIRGQPGVVASAREVRVAARYDGPAKVRLLHAGAAWGDPARPAYDLLAAILNGRSGRLYQRLVRDQKTPVFAAWASHTARRLGGQLVVDLEARGGAPADALLPYWERERRRLLDDTPPPSELERARQRLLSQGLRGLEEPADLLRQLLVYSALGRWRETTEWPATLARVGPEDVHRAALASLGAAGRLVALYRDGGRDSRAAEPAWTREASPEGPAPDPTAPEPVADAAVEEEGP